MIFSIIMNSRSRKSLIFASQAIENPRKNANFRLRLLHDHWELDNKLDIWIYLLLKLVPAVITKKIIRLAAERHGWRQIGYFGIFRLCQPYHGAPTA